ncbi:MAG: hypothetical protein AAF438_20380, partial [Pseudomonadota bacterium]
MGDYLDVAVRLLTLFVYQGCYAWWKNGLWINKSLSFVVVREVDQRLAFIVQTLLPTMYRQIVLTAFAFLLGCVLNSEDVYGQSALFESDEMVAVTLKTDLGMLFKDRGDDPKQQPASITYTGEDGEAVSQE